MTLCYIIMLSGHHPKTIPNGWNKLQTGGLSSRRRSTLSQDDVLGKITRRWWEVLRRVMEGTLNPDAVATAFQQIAEGTQDMLPTEMTVGNRTYKILGFLRGDEKSVIDHTMVERAKEMNANLGEDDGQFLLDNQQDIPVALGGGKVVFVFTDWHEPYDPSLVDCVRWRGGRWVQYWRWLDYGWGGHGRVLRRK